MQFLNMVIQELLLRLILMVLTIHTSKMLNVVKSLLNILDKLQAIHLHQLSERNKRGILLWINATNMTNTNYWL